MRNITLTIAGSDSGGGAGIQADLKTFAAHGVYGASVIVALTAQNTHGVTLAETASLDMVEKQLDAVFGDLPPSGIKTGMLASAEIIALVADKLEEYSAENIVVDPVMISAHGAPLLQQEAEELYRTRLMKRATLITPNLPEAATLLGLDEDLACAGLDRLKEVSSELLQFGSAAVLLKGGHLEGDEVIDILVTQGASSDATEKIWHKPKLDAKHTHGTGCTLSSAIAARLARGDDLVTAVEGGRRYLRRAIEQAWPLGSGVGPVEHLWPFSRFAE